MTKTLRALCAILAGAWFACTSLAQTGPQSLRQDQRSTPASTTSTPSWRRTEQEREIGLMFRSSMGANQGMLFAFERPGQQCFWMKNTLIPLDVAFVADDGVIVNIDHMKPQTLDGHCSEKPVRFVLEMNDGWFAKRGVRAGQKLTGLPAMR